MKTLILGIVLIILIGVGGFFYRTVSEQGHEPEPIACTEEAKICPDGSAVGREAPSCEFAPCAYPNVQLTDVGIEVAFPPGYGVVENESGDGSVSAIKASTFGSPPHTISIQSYPIAEGQTGDDVILANTRYQPADMDAENFDRFETVIVNGRTFRSTVIERFEAIVHSAYFLTRENDILRFDVVEHDVVEWMNPDLAVSTLPEHQALLYLLGTIQP